MKLHIGLFRNHPGWLTLLQQEGVSFSIVEEEKLHQDSYAVIILNAVPNATEQELLRTYLKKGGSLLTSTTYAEKLFDIKSRRGKIKYLTPEFSSRFKTNGLIDVWSFAKIPALANTLLTQNNKYSTFTGELGGGNSICFPFDLGELICNTNSNRKYFYATTKKLPAERVSLTGKNEIRKLVSSALESLFHQQGLPYIHLNYFPNGKINCFAFRIDSDYGTEEEIYALYNFLQYQDVHATWFLDVKSHQHYLRRFTAMAGHEIGLHCYEHQTFPDYRQNYGNIKRAYNLLEENGINPKGFVAPFGEWNSELNRAVEKFPFTYSSEFAFDYDNLPSFPIMQKKMGNVLQIPIHPMCIGTLHSAHMNEKEMVEYFSHIVDKKIVCREPLFFYTHPKEQRHNILRELFETIRKHDIPNMTFLEYALFWKERMKEQAIFSSEKFTPYYEGGNIIFSEKFDEISLRITTNEKNETMVNTGALQTKKIALQSLPFMHIPERAVPDDISKIRKFSPRLLNQTMQTYINRNLK